MDLITLAMAKPKVIDLDEYGIGQYVLYLFSQGGGTHTVEGVSGFWDAVNTNRPIEIMVRESGNLIRATGVTKASYLEIGQLSASVMLHYHDTVYTISINIQKLGEDAVVTVNVA